MQNSPNKELRPDHLCIDIKDLPSISSVVADTLRVINDPRSSALEIEAMIKRDQSLTARTLRVVNSAAYGFSRRIGSIREAVTMLGLRKVKSIATSMKAFTCFDAEIADIINAEDLWVHSLASSLWANEIINMKKLWAIDLSITASLLHDIGILILCKHAPKQYAPVIEESRLKNIHHVDLEKSLLGTTHATIGATLCAKWQLPVGLSQLINQHHTEEHPADTALSVVMLADYMANLFGDSPIQGERLPKIHQHILDSVDMTTAEFNRLKEMNQNIEDQTTALKTVSTQN